MPQLTISTHTEHTPKHQSCQSRANTLLSHSFHASFPIKILLQNNIVFFNFKSKPSTYPDVPCWNRYIIEHSKILRIFFFFQFFILSVHRYLKAKRCNTVSVLNSFMRGKKNQNMNFFLVVIPHIILLQSTWMWRKLTIIDYFRPPMLIKLQYQGKIFKQILIQIGVIIQKNIKLQRIKNKIIFQVDYSDSYYSIK